MLRVWLVVALAGCRSEELKVAFGHEDVPYGAPATAQPLAAGLRVSVDVIDEVWDFGEEDPTQTWLATADLQLEVTGARRVDCPAERLTGVCIVADGRAPVDVHFSTPHGDASARRDVSTEIALGAGTPHWGDHAPVDKIQLAANATTQLSLVPFDAPTHAILSGELPDLAATGVALALPDVTTGDPGEASIAVSGTSIAPLAIRVVTPATAAATIARFAANRVFRDDPAGDTMLTAYTEGTVGNVHFDAFDADGFLALPDVPFDVVTGPGLVVRDTCATGDFCFLRGQLPDGVDELMSFVELHAGTAVQRFPVRVVRGAY